MRGKCVVIIGGTTGLGFSAAKACVLAGANVVVVGRSPENAERAARQLGEAGRPLVGDASDPETADKAVQASLEAFGGFDGLYHVAGASGRSAGDGPLHELTDTGIEYTLALNLKSLLYSNRAAVQCFLERRTAGSVLNMGSVLGFSPAPAFFATHVYAAAKSAVIGLTKSAAAYYAKDNIRLNVIAPALVDTPMAQRAVGREAIRSYVATRQPLDGGRVGTPEDLDAAVVYFLSDRSKYVTGQVLAVDGGWTVSEGQINPAAPE